MRLYVNFKMIFCCWREYVQNMDNSQNQYSHESSISFKAWTMDERSNENVAREKKHNNFV